MVWTRAILFCLPLAALSAGGWSAWRARQAVRGSDLVMLMPGALPALNPFLPGNEAERQLLDLIHESLIRLDREGRLGTALAEQWSWHQNMTCWFATPAAAALAAKRLDEQPAEKRAAWDLVSATQDASSLIMRFQHPGGTVADEALSVLAANQPQRLTFLRIDAPPSARLAIEAYAAQADHAASTKRLWFDDDGTCEIVTTRTGLQEQQSLIEWLRPRHHPVPEVTPLAEVAALLEPVLDFRLKPGAQWPDGTRITAADVKATVRHVLPRPWPLPGRDAFRNIQDITEPEPGLVRVMYRKRDTSALPAWTALPVLPEAWLKQHLTDSDKAGPPGAGAWSVTRRDKDHLWLAKHSAENEPRLQVLSTTSPFQSRVGLATGSFDILWPTDVNRQAMKKEPGLSFLPTPPHNQLMLVWQTASPIVRDPHVRTALALGLDREALRQAMPGGQARLHDSFFPPGRWFSNPGAALTYDVKAADQQFAKAGWLPDVSGRLKRSGQPFHLNLIIPAGNADRLRLAQALAQAWDLLGVTLKVNEVAAESYVADLREGRFDVALVGAELAPGWDVLPMWHSTQAGGRGLNVSRLADDQLDLLLEALARAFDPAEVPQRAAAVESRLAELRPALPLFTDVAEMAVLESRFPGLPDLKTARGITLRELLPAVSVQTRTSVKLEMLTPR